MPEQGPPATQPWHTPPLHTSSAPHTVPFGSGVAALSKQTEVPVRDLVVELLEFVDDVVDQLGSRNEINHIYTILERGTSADRQLQIYRETNDLKAVVDDLITLTLENVPEAKTPGMPLPTTTTSTIAK